ncbi:hypothetical protein ERO13_A10G231766v2 [Gossypium hirsutum]|uniref:Uncharacterized protein n=1 Tax=Gossypium barbadense TaxID=3634 RepID=A0A5J5U7F8_GOSBA|nr:hypothetical protein ES319_A10G254100v1 [Gossypium barbadense]KAG4181497.1 hypothetical protein ERO13_A10G231766v2 [Gossypium hirsutum]
MKMEIIDVRKADEEAESRGRKRRTNMPHSLSGFWSFRGTIHMLVVLAI